MQLHILPAIVAKGKKRLGQGHGSGRVKTSGRGQKGANARGKSPIYFEGGAVPMTKRLPFLRGKNRNKPLQPKPIALNLSILARVPAKEVVSLETLLSLKIVTDEAKVRGVKLLGNGTVEQAYTIEIPVSKSAAEKITKAGGSVKTS